MNNSEENRIQSHIGFEERCGMSHNYEIILPGSSSERPEVTSYDSGSEYSLQHWVEVRRLVDESEEETTKIAEPPSEL